MKVWYVLGSKWWQLWRAFVRFDDEKEPPPPAAAETAEPAAPSSMDEDGVLVKAEDVAGVVGKADTNEHRVAELSLEEGGTSSSGGERGGSSYTERAGPGPIDNRTLGEGRELRETLVSHSAYGHRVCKERVVCVCWPSNWGRGSCSSLGRLFAIFSRRDKCRTNDAIGEVGLRLL